MNKTLAAASLALVLLTAVRMTAAFEPPQLKRAKASASHGKVNSKALAARRAKTAAYASVNQGIPLLEAGQYDAAIELFSKAIGQCPKLAKAYRCRGVALDQKGELDRALADLNRAVELDPNDPNNSFPRGCVLFNKGRYVDAIADFDFVIDSAPTAALAYHYRGRCWFKLGKALKALPDFSEAIRHSPKLAQAYSNRGELLAANGERQRAIEDFTRAIALDADDAWSANARAVLYLLQRDIEKGITDCNEAIQRDPKFSYAYQTRGAALLGKRDFDASIADSTKAIELRSDNRSWPLINRALAWMEKEEYGEAIRDLEAALDLTPDNDTACAALAYVFAACVEEQYRDARRAVELGIKACKMAEWKDVQSLDVLGMAYAEASDFERAAEHAQQALSIATHLPNSSKLRERLQERIELYRVGKTFHARAPIWLGEYADSAMFLSCFDKDVDVGSARH